MTKEDFNFEKAFQRLEEILEKMNQSKVSLDDSIKLYEEADGLIKACSKRLNEAEKKIEKLLKNRDGSLTLSEEGLPLSEDFE
jgi:exodeoxyribonuclease VII small subunit